MAHIQPSTLIDIDHVHQGGVVNRNGEIVGKDLFIIHYGLINY